jgi:gamma-glutamyltranspeptidase/glutathione hydrolase
MDQAWPEMPPAGSPRGSEGLPRAKVPAPQPDDVRPGDTSYLCVIDRHGNAFSCTPSDGSNHSPIIPGLGILASGRGTQSWADPTHPCSVAPGKRPRLTPNPALALKNGRALMPFGTPGGDVQVPAMIQVFLNVHVFGMDVQSAIEAPRFATYSFPGSFEPHPYFPGLLMMEKRIAAATGEGLAARGHRVEWWDEWTWLAGAPCAILADQERGILHGGADPRRPAYVLGW